MHQHPDFGDTPVNLNLSVVKVAANIYARGTTRHCFGEKYRFFLQRKKYFKVFDGPNRST
jgi:hypothetical protein